MILYIPLEVPVRELPGFLLLASVAVANGHQVLIASPNDLWLYKRLGLLKKGCYILKNMNVPSHSNEVYEVFLKAGFDLYCQEQEPGILWDQFEYFLKSRGITKNQALPFKGVFCWGERDTVAYKDFFKSRSEVFFNTGSPRSDLWHSKFSAIHTRTHIDALKPYILIVSNFGWLMGKKHLSKLMLTLRGLELLDSYQDEEILINRIEEDCTIAFNMIQGIKYIANKFPETRILIRPHPCEDEEYWRSIFVQNVNVEITENTESITPWIVGASAVIQNGCTSALEAVLQSVPVISFGPGRKIGHLNVPNLLGIRARNTKELEVAIEQIMNGNYGAIVQAESEDILKSLTSTQPGDAAFRIVRILEQTSKFNDDIKITGADLFKLRLVRTLKNLIDQPRKRFFTSGLEAPGYTLNQHDITNDINMMSEILGLPHPRLSSISKTGFLIE
ncbi:MAG: hypothetical protein NUV80_06260 [Candidatus Berkelbacteria bacterium]|nr:hypothetical protein [Candidatus Berkelbacteria bacterium]